MDRNTKENLVGEFGDKLGRAKLAVLTTYRGIDGNTLVDFRKKLASAEADAEFRVVKNKLIKLAVQGTDYESLSEHLTGPNAILFGYDDVVSAAKSLKDFAADNEGVIEVKGGAMDGKALTAEQVEALASMPSKEVLRAQLLGVLNGPARNFVGVLAAANRQIVNVLAAYRDKLEDEG